MRNSIIWAAAVSVLVAGCGGGATPSETTTAEGPVPTITPEVLAEMPHDTTAWTQGLEFDGPRLYEGTGVAGASQVRELDPETGAVLRAAAAPNNYYGEGITVVGDRIWELTWQNKVAVEWDKNTMTRCARYRSTARAGAVCRRGSAGPQRRVRPAVLPRSGDVRRDGFGCGHARRRPADKPQ